MRISLALILILAAAGASAVATFMGLQIKPELLGLPPVRVAPNKADPPRLPPRNTVTALGRLEPASEVVGVNAAPGSRIEKLAVREHDRVERGAVIAVLDTHDELKLAADHARALHAEAKDRYAAETAHAKTGIDAAEVKIREATEVLQKGIEAEEAAIRRVEAELEKARKDQGRSARMAVARAIPESQLDTANLAVTTLTAASAEHKANLAQLVSAREVKLAGAHTELASAKANLTRLQKSIPLDSLEAAAKLADARYARTTVRAAISGEVLKIHVHEGETTGNSPILLMGDTATMVAIAEVYETDAARVAPGQKVSVTSKAFPDQKITGTVESISALVHKKDVLSIDPAADSDARVLEARVKLDDAKLAARFNHLQVDVAIEVGKP